MTIGFKLRERNTAAMIQMFYKDENLSSCLNFEKMLFEGLLNREYKVMILYIYLRGRK